MLNLIKSAAAGLVIFFFTGCSISHQQIKAEGFSEFHSTRKIQTLLVDTRTPELYKAGHMPGAVNIPSDTVLFKQRVIESIIPPPADIWIMLLYAHDINQTEELQKRMMDLYRRHAPFRGPTALFYCEGGYLKWKKISDLK